MARPPAPVLLVSVHDVSPLTLDACRRALSLVEAAGVARHALTLLAIPRHEDRISLHEHAPTMDWLRGLAADGATLVTHGYTHRMEGRSLNPRGLIWAHAFARGQGEFFRTGEAEAVRRLEAARATMSRAGLEGALGGFVPPAWLLSAASAAAVARAGFGFHETMGGIVHQGRLRARRLIGLGSLTAPEARATAAWAALLARLPAADTRLAIHPADLDRASSRRALERTLAALLERLSPVSYAGFLRGAA